MNAGSPHRSAAEHRIDVVATLLLAFATLATAWAGYQASRWHSEQAKAQQAANASRIESTRATDDANRQAEVDIELFIQWVDAQANGDADLAAFWRDRFTDRLKPAFNAWIAKDPLDNPSAPLSPFEMSQYRLSIARESHDEEVEANAAGAEATEAIERADHYVLAVVLFAACLFFAGISTRLRTQGGQVAILVLGWVLFLATAVWVATFPVTVYL